MDTADLILTSATVYTVDPERPWATDLAISGEKVLAVGDRDEVARHRGPGTAVVDLGGAFVTPGLVDVHNHHALAGMADLFELSVDPAADLAQVLAAVAERARASGPDEWVVGGSWGSHLVGELSREQALRALDEASCGRPVLLSDDSHHNRWVNSRALQLAGIGADTADPDGGAIVRDRDTGRPTGLLLERAGIAAARAVHDAAAPTAEQHRRASRRAVEILHSYGITAFQDAGASREVMRALQELDGDGELTAWVVSSMLINDPIFGFSPIGAELLAEGERYRSTHHRPGFVKIFLDGVPPTRTAAFLDPYLPDHVHGAHHHGELSMPPEELAGWLRTVAEAGLSAKIHCTGDASVRATLDAVAKVRADGNRASRFQIAHGQFVHPQDVPRFAELDVSADISPFLWFPGVIPAAIAEVRPPELAGRMQPNRALLDSGALVAGGSDWPVSTSPNAWEGIQGLVTRQDPSGAYAGSLWPEQALSLAEAIEVFTLNGARAMGLAEVTGSLVPGKSADFVVTDRNPFDGPVTEVASTVVEETWFAGRRVHRRSDR
ncbi:amidohydrolase [Saccharopolyspora hirsuta]|uniref:Amidohydrolase n=1 Tax=Saccharopolyspora hirsuta TaxID=1837 RepID=A0A5M7C9G6_SACHI|nr:amidohydrolase [Saccharopolyspora hirsuta]KAA5838413.1 amidohydrolase [Saccharopolyspora hirsuta]